MPDTPVQPPGGQAGPSASPDIPSNLPHDPTSPVPQTVQHDQHNEPQTHSIMASESGVAAADGIQHEGRGRREPAARVRRGKKTDLTEEELQSRRELAEERIRQGGWRPDVAERAIEVTQAYKWNDAPSTVWNVSLFLRRAEGLGVQCSNMKKIRRVLDRDIHRFIAIHAMQKDFQVPKYLIHKANQRLGETGLMYPWLRSFILEYRGLPRETEESLVQPYREQVDEQDAGDHGAEPAQADHDGDIRVATPAAPEPAAPEPAAPEPDAPEPDVPEAPAPAAAAPDPCRARAVSEPSGEPRQLALANNERRRKRRRILHGPEIDNPAKKVKTERIEDDLVELQDTGYDATTSRAGMQDAARPPLTYDIRGVPHAGKRTLTVFFHGMTAEGTEGSESHVQVYVPRTSSGVTINFL